MEIKLITYDNFLFGYRKKFFVQNITEYNDIIITLDYNCVNPYINSNNNTITIGPNYFLNKYVITHELLHKLYNSLKKKFYYPNIAHTSLSSISYLTNSTNCTKIFNLINNFDENQNVLEHFLLIELFVQLGYEREKFTKTKYSDICMYDKILSSPNNTYIGYNSNSNVLNNKQFYQNLFVLFFESRLNSEKKQKLIVACQTMIPNALFTIFHTYFIQITLIKNSIILYNNNVMNLDFSLIDSASLNFILNLENYIATNGGLI